jgi:dihydroflavonol-4-reductase
MGLQFLFKNKIAPNPFFEMIYNNNIYWAIVDVADVSEAIYKAATTKNIHGKNYLLSSESYRVSDVTLMLNNQAPIGEPIIFYSNELAKKDLGVHFKPARLTLNEYSM